MRIALVGGGPAAACMMESLIRARDEINRDAPLDITVFDPSPHLWCGPSFGPDMDEALMNTYTSDMSIRYWDPDHITQWMKENGYTQFAGTKFAPREIIGKYIRDSAEKAALRMNAFELVREQVTKVAVDGCVLIETPMRNYEFDYAVLCMGGATASDLYGLMGHDRFSSTPYPLKDTLGRIGADEHVGIIGSGLTAVDLVLGLKANHHRGPITLLSRRGLLPGVRRPPVKYEVQYFTVKGIEELVAAKGRITLQDLIDLTYKELDHAGASKHALIDEILSNRYGIERLRHQLARVHDGEIAHQLGIKMLVAAYEDAWYFLSNAEKKYLFSHFRPIAYSLAGPMPEHRAAQILELADAGQLNVIRGLQSVSTDTTGKFVAKAEGLPPIRLDRVFSATTGEDRLSPMAVPIIDGLVRSGQARLHPFGGLDVERTTSRIIDARNCAQPHLYGLGCTVGGALYIFNAFILFAQRTVHIADSIVQHAATVSTS